MGDDPRRTYIESGVSDPARVKALYDLGFNDVLLHGWVKQGVLVLALFRRLKGGSGGSNYFDREFFYREDESPRPTLGSPNEAAVLHLSLDRREDRRIGKLPLQERRSVEYMVCREAAAAATNAVAVDVETTAVHGAAPFRGLALFEQKAPD